MLRNVIGLMLAGAPLIAQPTRTIDKDPLVEIIEYDQRPLGLIAGAATLRNGAIVVADASFAKLYTFSPQGQAIGNAGRAGAGPGEFRSMAWVGSCGENSVSIFDFQLNRVVVLGSDGRLDRIKSAISPVPYYLFCSTNGSHVLVEKPTDYGQFHSQTVGPHRSTVRINIVKPNGSFIALGTFAGPERFRWERAAGPRPYGKDVVLALSATKIYVGTADSFFVQIFDFDGKRVGSVSHPAKAKELTDKDKEAHVQKILKTYPNRHSSPVDVPKMRFAFNLAAPSHIPVYERFVVAGDTLWVQEGKAPSDTAIRWLGFDAGGKPVGQIVVPSEFHVYEVSDTTVLGKWTSYEGIESVRRFRLVPLRGA